MKFKKNSSLVALVALVSSISSGAANANISAAISEISGGVADAQSLGGAALVVIAVAVVFKLIRRAI